MTAERSLEAKRQAEYRRRRTERAARMEAALQAIIAELGDKPGPKGKAIIALAQEGLK